MRVNFSVTNQLATPSIHAAALANRPPAGQPGRLFVDTDNPSSGIYRDTGTVWENITGGAGAGNLQTVTDAGNTTDNNILLTYPDNTLANALVFYNDQLAQEEYLIEKRGTGITTNDSLAIQSRGNISPSTNPVGFLIDGANEVIKSFYTTSYSEAGLKLDFLQNVYQIRNWSGDNYLYIDGSITRLGGLTGYINFDDGSNQIVIESTQPIKFGNVNGGAGSTVLIVDDNTQIIKTTKGVNDAGLKLDFANGIYEINDVYGGTGRITIDSNLSEIQIQSQRTVYIGDGVFSGYGTSLFNDDQNQIIKTKFGGNDIGLYLDFANKTYKFGQIDNTMTIRVNGDTSNRLIELGELSGNYDMTTLYIDDNTSTIKTSWQGADIGLKLDFVNDQYYLGKFNGLTYIFANVVNDEIYIDSAGYRNFQAAADLTQIGDNNGNGNTTTFGVNDSSQKLVASTNLLVGSSGSSSGQHLKIKVGTTDYVIELKNP